MAVWVYTCTGTRGESVNLSGQESGVCSPASAGSWVEAETLAAPFDPATLDAATLASAFGAGFTIMAVPLIAIWMARQVLAVIHKT